jgi:hypothetical protein
LAPDLPFLQRRSKNKGMIYVRPEFPESALKLVEQFAIAHGYIDFTRDEAKGLLDDFAADLLETKGLKSGESHSSILRRLESEGPGFIVFPMSPAFHDKLCIDGRGICVPKNFKQAPRSPFLFNQ